jgi:hypothetical protein
MTQVHESLGSTAVARVVPPLPEHPTEDALAEWLRQTVPLMDSTSRYGKDLARALARYDFNNRRRTQSRSSSTSETQQGESQ